MISIKEAKQWVLDKSFELDEVWISIDQSVGRVLSQEVQATFDLPSFRNSAMDGYAMLRTDLEQGIRKFKVAGEIQAGRSETIILQNAETYRIFTGAVLPKNADMVVIQEKTDLGESEVEVTSYNSRDKSNVRDIGEQIKKSETALPAGHVINPASVGLLASFGIGRVLVYSLPKIGVITTGNELKKLDEELSQGEIFESNSYSLKSALNKSGFSCHLELTVSDDFERTTKEIGSLLNNCDVLIISGGISVGKYDYVKSALEKNGVDEVFYKINQKPGKPMYFGVKSEKLVFALPGNPASLLVCYYEYVLLALNKLKGNVIPNVTLEKKLIRPNRKL